ncbi:MAG TPA: YfhO family protein [Candidatus Brocadiia bacterium]|nr:YfhO family protein [Candidatus Brocadiia bacterium]
MPDDIKKKTAASRKERVAADLCCAAFFLAIVLYLYSDMVFGGRYPMMSDQTMYGAHSPTFLKWALHSGEIPLWNPFNSCGEPYVPSIYSCTLIYPGLAVPSLLFSGGAVWTAVQLVHIWAAGFLMYLYLRTHSASVVVCVMGGLVYMLNSHMLMRLQFPVAGFVTSLMPLSLMAWERALRRQSLLSLLLAGLALSLQINGNQVQVLGFCGLALAFTWLFDFANAVRARAGRARIAILLAAPPLACFFALCFSAYFMAPLLEYSRLSSRAIGLNWEAATRYSLPPAHFLTLLIPNLFGNSEPSSFWNTRVGWHWNGACYAGLAALPLTLIALLRRSSPESLAEGAGANRLRFLAIAGIFSGAAFSLGRYFPVMGAAYDLFPPFRTLRWPSMGLVMLVFGLSVGSAIGWHSLTDALAAARRESPDARKVAGLIRRIAWCGLAVFCLLNAALWISPESALGIFAGVSHSAVSSPLHEEAFRNGGGVVLDALRWFGAVALALCAWAAWALRDVAPGAGSSIPRATPMERAAWPGTRGMIAIVAFLAIMLVDLIHIGKPLWVTSDVDVALADAGAPPGAEKVPPMARWWTTNASSVLGGLHGCRDAQTYLTLKSLRVPYLNHAGPDFSAWGMGPIWPWRWTLLTLPLSAPDSSPESRARILGLMGVFREFRVDPIPSLDLRFRASSQPVPDDLRFDRAWVATKWARLKQWQGAEAVWKGIYDLRGVAILETENDAEISTAPAALPDCATSAEIGLPEYTANTVCLRVRLNGNGILVLADTYYPGWRAWVDGVETPIIPVDVLFRGLNIGPGDHEVRFEFISEPFYMGAAISAATWAVTLALFILSLLRRRNFIKLEGRAIKILAGQF